ncbi:MAG: PEP-CTERM sorting domain-containing protein [Rhodobacteraceae bacterium]|nr:PEP-CTERM sorting domain-containing protein [Paracoccaceae bacterium]
MLRTSSRLAFGFALTVAVSGPLMSTAQAAPIFYTDWTSATVATAGSASGTILTPGGPVTVTYTGQVHSPTQTSCGADFWNANPAIYAGSPADNGPGRDPNNPAVASSANLRCDMISMTGGSGVGVSTFSFDRPILNPIMSILSLGQGGVGAELIFDQSFTIISQGNGWYGGSPTALTKIEGNARGGDTLKGFEGHGAIMFEGSFQTLTWTMPIFENWYGFTIGVQGIATPAPGALALFGVGALGLLGLRRRKR